VMSFTGESEDIEDYRSHISYKVINLATRQVKWQDMTEIDMDINSPKTAGRVARDIMNAIYPIKVVANTATAIVLNQGGKSVEKGEVFDVFVLGEKMIDPYTKESLGRIEIPAGQIEINRITSKLSYAKIISGNYQEMVKGSIVRLTEEMPETNYPEQTIPNNYNPQNVKPSSAGGVIIPAANLNKKPLTPSPAGGVVIDP